MDKLSQLILDGNRRALSKAITHIENRTETGKLIVSDLYRHRKTVPIIGITGPPGAGKSTLISELIKLYKSQSLKIGILAIDPTSVFSGGAILGDRIRMMESTSDGSVFVRSMASRGILGGLSSAAFNVLSIMECFGFDLILLESVGAGQNEIEIHQYCDTVIVVAVSGLGDDIQAIKAGIYEIPDIFLIHKSDLPGSKELRYQIETILEMTPSKSEWRVPILLASSKEGTGIMDLIDKIKSHQEYLAKSNKREELRTKRTIHEIKRQTQELVLHWLDRKNIEKTIEGLVQEGKLSPNEIANQLFEKLGLDK